MSRYGFILDRHVFWKCSLPHEDYLNVLNVVLRQSMVRSRFVTDLTVLYNFSLLR